MEKTLQAIHDFVAHKIAEGFDPEDRIIEQALALFVNEEAYCPSYWDFLPANEPRQPESAVRPHIERIAAQLLEERRRQEAAWPGPTDCDRMDQAFAALERNGIVPGQNLLCCMTCARAEISTIVGQKVNKGLAVVGYVFYHEQDTARAPQGQLLLAFGSIENDKEQTVRIGRRIVEALTHAGLKTVWQDDPDARIVVKLEWKKRRF